MHVVKRKGRTGNIGMSGRVQSALLHIREACESETYFSGCGLGLHRRSPRVEVEHIGGWGGQPQERGLGTWDEHATVGENRAKRPKASEGPARCSESRRRRDR